MRFTVRTALLLVVPALAEAQRPATLTGKVLADTTLRPIVGAEVMIPELSKTATADDKGAFKILDIPPGTHLVRARRVGYAVFEARVEFKEGQATERAIVLPRLTSLDSVRVVGEANVPLSYLEHRAVGLGHFVTCAELEKQGNRKLSDIIFQVPGLAVIGGTGGQGYIYSKRNVPRLNNGGRPSPTAAVRGEPGRDFYWPDEGEKNRGLKPGCYARVYLDNSLLNMTTPADPVDINQFSSASIEAIEYYSGPSQVPMKYSRLNSTCGVLVIHTRRSP